MIRFIRFNEKIPSALHALCFMVFFWTLFDASLSYITPLLISSAGFSTTMMGIIYGTSSVAGAIFDFLICKFVRNLNHRRLFLIMFLICAMYPFVLGTASIAFVFILTMAIWGLYYDLYSFGLFDFVTFSTGAKSKEMVFGQVQMYKYLATTIAPFIVGFILVGAVYLRVFILAEVFLGVALLFYVVLCVQESRHKNRSMNVTLSRKRHLLLEIHIWERIGKKIFPLLIATFFLILVEAVFWTLSPLYAEMLHLGAFSGLFLCAYTFPILLAGFIVSRFEKSLGGAKLALGSLLLGSVVLIFSMFSSSYVSAILVFVSAFFFGLAIPLINGSYSEYIESVPLFEGEIESLEDFFTNLAYIVGPMVAGLIADLFSIPMVFTLLGVVGFVVAVILMFVHIRKFSTII